MALCAAFFCADTTTKNLWTVRTARALSPAWMWVTDLSKCRIFTAARVIVTIRTAFCRDARRRANVCVVFFLEATTRDNP